MITVDEGPYDRTTALWHVREYVTQRGWSGSYPDPSSDKHGRIVKIEKKLVAYAEVWVLFEGETKPRPINTDVLRHRKV